MGTSSDARTSRRCARRGPSFLTKTERWSWTTRAGRVRLASLLGSLWEVLTIIAYLGNVSQQLCQYVKSVVGVDISQASVDHFNALAANQGLEPDEMRAVCTELKGEPRELNGVKFDIVVVSARILSAVLLTTMSRDSNLLSTFANVGLMKF